MTEGQCSASSWVLGRPLMWPLVAQQPGLLSENCLHVFESKEI